jgi:hypothetical protein
MSIPGSVNPLFLGAAGQATGGGEYQIERSVRFNSPDSAYLSRTPGTAGNRKTWTLAGWVKRTSTDGSRVFGTANSGNTEGFHFQFKTDSTLIIYDYSSSTLLWQKTTTQVFRDFSAWFHVVLAFDSTQVTASDRFKLYINGTIVTQFSTSSDPSLNFDSYWNAARLHAIGRNGDHPVGYFNGTIADIHFIDGQALDPSSFGEFDTNGVWQPIEFTPQATPNDGTVWSSNISGDAAQTSDPRTGGFDGSLSTSWRVDQPSSNTLYTSTFTPPTAIPFTTLRIYAHPDIGGSAYWKVNGVSQSAASEGWITPTGVTSPLSSFEITAWNNGSSFYWTRIFAVEVDGVILIDGDTANIGLNGFHLPFSDNSTAAALGTDTSSNGNDWTVNNISVAAGAGNDSLVDSPTNGSQTDTGVGGEVVGNYCTFNPLDSNASTLSNGNLELTGNGSARLGKIGTIGVSSGKWYWEVVYTSTGGWEGVIGVVNQPVSNPLATSNAWVYYVDGKKANGSLASYGASWAPGDVMGVALDLDNGTLVFYKNNVSQGTAFSGLTGTFFPYAASYHTYEVAIANFGQRQWAYAAPAGFKALCTTNLPEPTIADGSTVMDVKLYTGNGSTQTISGLNFSPDFLWIKSRSTAQDPQIFDAVRGVPGNYYALQTNSTAGEGQYGTLSALTSDGFTMPIGGGATNFLNTTYVAWCWDAGSSTVTNTQGSITSQVRANASAGFSVVKYTNVASTNSTIGHGLGVAPKLLIVRYINQVSGWFVYHADAGAGKYLDLQSTGSAVTLSSLWNNTAPTSTVFSVGTAWTGSLDTIAYCFAPVAGYSSAFTWSGTGSTDGPAIYLGFRPKLIIWKRTDSAANWAILDSSRSSYNVADDWLGPNSSSAEAADNAAYAMDFLSNGLKIRATHEATNQSGGTYIGFAFAESPFKNSRAR